MPKMSFAEYAKYRGVTKAAVTLAIKRGKLSVETSEDGKRYLDSEKADREWAETTNVALAMGPQSRKIGSTSNVQPDDPPVSSEPQPNVQVVSGMRAYNEARAAREHYNAELARLKFEEQAGKLIAAERVRDDAFRTARYVRDALLAIPDRVAGELAGETNQFRIHQRLTEEIRRALISLESQTVDEAPDGIEAQPATRE